MNAETVNMPTMRPLTESEIVAQLAADVDLHGWKVTNYTTGNDLEKQEKTLTIKLWRSTGDGQQTALDLRDGERQGGRHRGGGGRGKASAPAAEAGREAEGDGGDGG